MTRNVLSRLRAEWRDLVELVLLPGLAAVLPWRLCFALFKQIAKWPWLYRENCSRALAEAQARGWVHDVSHWVQVRRLVTLVDHADHYLALTRSDQWITRHVTVVGAWPTKQVSAQSSTLLCTFHWGAGMWALRHVAQTGLTPNALVASLDPAYFAGRQVLYRYALSRTAAVAKVLQRPTIDVSKNLRAVLKAMHAREPILAAIDAPADQANASQTIPLLGMMARVPTALLRMAVERKLPVTVFTTGLDLATGQRILRLHALEVEGDLEQLVSKVFTLLSDVMRAEPAAWHFWSEAPRFFIEAEPG